MKVPSTEGKEVALWRLGSAAASHNAAEQKRMQSRKLKELSAFGLNYGKKQGLSREFSK